MRLLGCAFLVSCLVSLPIPARAGMIFPILFDTNFQNANFVAPPFVGVGQLSFSNDLPDGSYPLASLNDLAFSATIGGETWTEADTVSFQPGTAIVIDNSGRQFYFDGSEATPYSGALDIVNGHGEVLSFEPNWFTAAPWNLYSTSTGFEGTYGITPEPTTWCLALSGAVYCLVAAQQRQRSLKPNGFRPC